MGAAVRARRRDRRVRRGAAGAEGRGGVGRGAECELSAPRRRRQHLNARPATSAQGPMAQHVCVAALQDFVQQKKPPEAAPEG